MAEENSSSETDGISLRVGEVYHAIDVRALADATGESITEAIRRALEERLERESKRVSSERMRAEARRGY